MKNQGEVFGFVREMVVAVFNRTRMFLAIHYSE